jgi:hypothetical protein
VRRHAKRSNTRHSQPKTCQNCHAVAVHSPPATLDYRLNARDLHSVLRSPRVLASERSVSGVFDRKMSAATPSPTGSGECSTPCSTDTYPSYLGAETPSLRRSTPGPNRAPKKRRAEKIKKREKKVIRKNRPHGDMENIMSLPCCAKHCLENRIGEADVRATRLSFDSLLSHDEQILFLGRPQRRQN